MPETASGIIILTVALIGLPIFLLLCLMAYLYEQAHGGNPVKLTRGLDLNQLGIVL